MLTRTISDNRRHHWDYTLAAILFLLLIAVLVAIPILCWLKDGTPTEENLPGVPAGDVYKRQANTFVAYKADKKKFFQMIYDALKNQK